MLETSHFPIPRFMPSRQRVIRARPVSHTASSLAGMMQRRAHRLAVAARVMGWMSNEEFDADTGARIVTARHPEIPSDCISVRFLPVSTAAGNPGMRTLARRTKSGSGKRMGHSRGVALAASTAQAILLAPPTRVSREGREGEVFLVGEPIERVDDGCSCCGRTSPPQAALTLTATGLCFGCREWHLRFADDVIDPACLHISEPHSLESDWLLPHRWRADPRTWVDDDGSGKTARWLRSRGITHLLERTDGWGQMYALEHDGLRLSTVCLGWDGETTVTAHFVTGGRTYEVNTNIAYPARHELLDILTVMEPHLSATPQGLDALTRLTTSDDRGTRELARQHPRYEEVSDAARVEGALLGEAHRLSTS